MTILLVIIFSILGSVGTFYLNKMSHQGPVFSSALTLLVVYGGLKILGLPQDLTTALSAASFGGSFAGMSAETRLQNPLQFGVAGGLFGIIFLLTRPYFIGFGGGLGFKAFISVLLTMGLVKIFFKRATYFFLSLSKA